VHSVVLSSKRPFRRYAMRDKIGEGAELGPFISSEDRATFGKMLEEIEEWLYSEEADEGTKVVFCNKLDQLKTHGSPLEARAHEASARPEAAASFRAALEEYRSFVSSVNRGDEKYAHITPEQAEKVSSNCNEAETWLEDKLNAQKDLALYQDPIVKAHEIKSKMTALQVQCRPIVNTPKPAPPKEEKPAAAPAPAAAEGEPAAAADGAAPAGPTPSVDMELD
jgi:heat shock protein 4